MNYWVQSICWFTVNWNVHIVCIKRAHYVFVQLYPTNVVLIKWLYSKEYSIDIGVQYVVIDVWVSVSMT